MTKITMDHQPGFCFVPKVTVRWCISTRALTAAVSESELAQNSTCTTCSCKAQRLFAGDNRQMYYCTLSALHVSCRNDSLCVSLHAMPSDKMSNNCDITPVS